MIVDIIHLFTFRQQVSTPNQDGEGIMALAALCHLTATISRFPDLQQILQDSLDLVFHQVTRIEAGVILFLLAEQTGEMAALVGGHGRLDSRPGAGTRVVVEAPR